VRLEKNVPERGGEGPHGKNGKGGSIPLLIGNSASQEPDGSRGKKTVVTCGKEWQGLSKAKRRKRTIHLLLQRSRGAPIEKLRAKGGEKIML